MLLPATIGQSSPPATAVPAPPAPRAGWPAKATLDYHKTLIELLLLVLAIPWILKQLAEHPGKVSREAAAHHLRPGA